MREAAVTAMRTQLNALHLVYPPISNQEAEWLKDVPEVRERMSESHLYFIGKRNEAKFIGLRHEAAESGPGRVHFNFEACGISDPVTVRLDDWAERGESEDLILDAGLKHVRLSDASSSEVSDWATTEGLLYKKARGDGSVEGLERYREFLDYELLYVGISPEQGAFERLVRKPHEKRVRILTNEYPQYGSRVSDETYFFFFRIEPFRIDTYELLDPVSLIQPPTVAQPVVVRDAEQAYTHVLRPPYNVHKFAGYPVNQAGLHGSDLGSYSYVICDDLTFRTENGVVRGARGPHGSLSNDADTIVVQAGLAELVTREAMKLRYEQHR